MHNESQKNNITDHQKHNKTLAFVEHPTESDKNSQLNLHPSRCIFSFSPMPGVFLAFDGGAADFLEVMMAYANALNEALAQDAFPSCDESTEKTLRALAADLTALLPPTFQAATKEIRQSTAP